VGRPTAWTPMARVAIGEAAAATTTEAATTAATMATTIAGDEREDEEREAFLLLRSRRVVFWSRCRLLAGILAGNAGEDSLAVASFPRETPSSVLVAFCVCRVGELSMSRGVKTSCLCVWDWEELGEFSTERLACVITC